MDKKKLEGIVKTKCNMCNEPTPHYYVGKVEANRTYYLYKCLYECQKKNNQFIGYINFDQQLRIETFKYT